MLICISGGADLAGRSTALAQALAQALAPPCLALLR